MPGTERTTPIPPNQEAAAGPWALTLLDVITGAEAADRVATSDLNDPAAEGFAYYLVNLRARNAGDRPLSIATDDFALTGPAGVVYRFASPAVPPEPPLTGTAAPGETLEGWIALRAPADEAGQLLFYDSLALSGTWPDRFFALTADAPAVPAPPEGNDGADEAGATPATPAGLTTPVRTAGWAVELLEAIRGQEVYDRTDFRTQALGDSGPDNIPRWLALRVRVTNTAAIASPAFLSPTAFQLADAAGEAIPEVTTLTPPEPDASGSYFPGGARDGWVAFQRPSAGGDSLIRFLPFTTGPSEPRYLTLGDSVAAPIDLNLAAGDTVTVIETEVNLRVAATTDSEIVTVLTQGTTLTITGPPEDADGYTWYPVADPATGDEGFIAQNFLAPAE